MKDEKDIGQVRKAFLEEEFSAPEAIWDAISEELDHGDQALDHSVNDAFTSLEQAPEALWEGIDRQLTIDSVWNRVRRYLTALHWMNRWAQGGLTAVLLLCWLPMLHLTTPLFQGELSPTEPSAAIRTPSGHTPVEGEGAVAMEPQATPVVSTPRNTASLGTVTNLEAVNPIPDAAEPADPADMIEALPVLLIAKDMKWIPYATELDETHSGPFALLAIDFDPPVVPGPSFGVGLIGTVHSPRISNNVRQESERTGSTTESELTLNVAVGIAGHVQFAGGDRVEAAYLHNQVMAQSYNRFEGGDYVHYDLILLYDKFNVQYSKGIGGAGRPPLFYVQGGLFAAHLSAASLFSGESGADVSASYTDWDAGVRIGIKRAHPLGPILLEYGVAGEWGVGNVYRGDGRIPSDFDVTYTRNTAIELGVKYAF